MEKESIQRLISSRRFRSLRTLVIVRIFLPLFFISIGLVLAGTYTYDRIVTSVISDRHRQLADLAATSVSEVIEGYVSLLESLAAQRDVQSQNLEERQDALREAKEVLALFDAGVLILDRDGKQAATTEIQAGSLLSDRWVMEAFHSLSTQAVPSFRTLHSAVDGEDAIILIAVPSIDDGNQMVGAVVGAMYLRSTAVSQLIQRFSTGQDGFAYLVDRDGKILAHPDPLLVGADHGHWPFIQSVTAGETGAELTNLSTGERLVEGFAPIKIAGWGLVIQESWNSATAPIGLFGGWIIALEAMILFLALLLSWKGFERITKPIQALHEQTEKLARGEPVEPTRESGVDEIDALESAFLRMAAQISAYQAGLRRYVGAITRSQEDERRRIARELHDDTVQNLLAVARQLELYGTSEANPERREKIASIAGMVTGTLAGIRQINRDLRPLMLDDLGLIPALQTLVRASRQGEGAIPQARFETDGQPIPLTPEQELVLYRITQEALTNIRKHAHATAALVNLSFRDGIVRLEIEDDGQGFIMAPFLTDFAQQERFGLLGIQERAWAVGGSVVIQSSHDLGTKIAVVFPV